MPVFIVRAVLATFGVAGLMLASGCARGARAGSQPPASTASPPAPVAGGAVERGGSERAGRAEADPQRILAEAEQALAADEAARAVALFGRVLVSDTLPPQLASPAWIGLAQSHEKLRDCTAAIRAYQTYLDRYPEGEYAVLARGRRGACEAELERWEESAATFHAIAERNEPLPSVQVEALAREGYALYMLDRLDAADARLAAADAVYERAVEHNAERFSNTYFVGMARFYRAAIIHQRFRTIEIRRPEKAMKASFDAKLARLVEAQEAYNHAIRAKHMFWVSAAGYQLGHLFSELYDALMYAPVPEWLDAGQREIYFEELKKQLRPVVTKAIWVFEKNLETARRLGYHSDFIERTEVKLGHLQAVMLSEEATLGRANPRLGIDPRVEPGDAPPSDDGQNASDRKLFIPRPTPL